MVTERGSEVSRMGSDNTQVIFWDRGRPRPQMSREARKASEGCNFQ